MKRRIISIVLIALMLLGLAGCNRAGGGNENQLKIICTVFPQYDWVRNILGDHAEKADLTLLMDNGADLHNYQATMTDLMAIADCDLFIYVGGESDEWVTKALENPTNENRRTLCLMDAAEQTDLVATPTDEHDHDHDHGTAEQPEEPEHDHDHDHEGEDEHVWLSLRSADRAIAQITTQLMELDPEHSADYFLNSAKYRAQVQALDSRYQSCVDTATRKTLVFADRFPFSRLAADYGLECYAAFTGCSAETEASFATLTALTEKVNELQLPAVMVIETSDQSIAKTVIQNSDAKNQQILVTDSMQAVTQARIDAGETYLNIMEKNLAAFEKALH